MALANVTLPPVPTGTMTRLGTVLPPVQLTLDALGVADPVGYAVSQLVAVVLVTVASSTMAETPLIGSPPLPVICTSSVAPAWRVRPALGMPLPARVSEMR